MGGTLTSGVVALFLLAVLVSTFFVEGLDPAWQFGLPFFVLLVVTYLVMKKSGRCDHLLAEPRLPDHQSTPTDA